MWETIVIMEEGNRPHPRCPGCDMFSPWKALNGRHITVEFLSRGSNRKFLRLATEEYRARAETAFLAYDPPPVNLMEFKYLGCVLMAMDDYWTEMVMNIRKDRKKWAQMSKIMDQ